ncbi:hypothetical protein LOK46_17505 [Methylobacterium sp. NMS14P]|uniref:hypothetical protein n=1 Tax=Methylobacterium sp. NMS14P TaxID=2894310 RepID=UPI00235950EC|nr:hypothetical protein [Methylobacterium sp. NMS14P]WCS22981.1 hypothetical protein LOK46_17505 [Methylobacterium sp. NMS14P]
MRHVIGTSSAAAVGTLCILAFVGWTPVPGTAPGAVPAEARGVVPAAAARDGAPCAGAAWPYPPGACAGSGTAGGPAARRVRLIAVDAAPGTR